MVDAEKHNVILGSHNPPPPFPERKTKNSS